MKHSITLFTLLAATLVASAHASSKQELLRCTANKSNPDGIGVMWNAKSIRVFADYQSGTSKGTVLIDTLGTNASTDVDSYVYDADINEVFGKKLDIIATFSTDNEYGKQSFEIKSSLPMASSPQRITLTANYYAVDGGKSVTKKGTFTFDCVNP